MGVDERDVDRQQRGHVVGLQKPMRRPIQHLGDARRDRLNVRCAEHDDWRHIQCAPASGRGRQRTCVADGCASLGGLSIARAE
jgi:hypothetical protein